MSSIRETVQLGLADPESPDAQRVLLFRLLVANAQELRTRMDRLLAESGLTTQQAMLLQVLQGEEEPPTLTQFAARLAMSHQNLKQIAAVLVRKGLVKILPDPGDARVRRLHLTARHRRLWQQRDPGDHAEVRGWTAALSDREVKAAVTTLGTLFESLIASREAEREP
jgi:DNA-binding MarR family transcriptional regulator